MAGTVFDFRNMLFRRVGVAEYFQFARFRKDRLRFLQKLNALGARRIKELPPEKVPDIDATVVLTDDEWFELDQELQKLLDKG